MKNFSSKTKENYLHSSSAAHLWKRLGWILLAFLILYSGQKFVSNVSGYITTPFYMVRHYIESSSATIPVFIRSRLELLDDIRALELEIETQKGKDAAFLFITEENAELRSLLNASSSPRIVAGVISRPPQTPYDTLIIDQGTDDGIVEDAPVYYGAGRAIGYIHHAFTKTALVTLFSSPGVETTVYIYGPNMFTTAYGEGGGVIRLSVPQGIVLEKGNTVILPSLDTGTLGVVDDIQSIATEPEQHAYVTFGSSLQSVRLVSVGTSPIHATTYTEALKRVHEVKNALFKINVPLNASTSPMITGTHLQSEATTTAGSTSTSP